MRELKFNHWLIGGVFTFQSYRLPLLSAAAFGFKQINTHVPRIFP